MKPVVTTRWTPQLVLEDALGLFSDEELCERFGMSLGTLTSIRSLAPYATAMLETRSEVAAQGLTFRHKARLQAEVLLEKAFDWAVDVDTPAKDRLSILAKMVEWGELGPKQTESANAGFTFVVNLPGAQQTIEARTFDNGG